LNNLEEMVIQFLKRHIQKIAYNFGYEIFRIGDDITEKDMDIIRTAKPYTLTDTSTMKSLIEAVKYLEQNKIEGSFVECGVWRGGSVLVMIKTLQQLGVNDREIYLFDTFAGLNKPTNVDVKESGEVALELDYNPEKKDEKTSLEIVKKTILDTGYDNSKIHFIKGEVEKTLSKTNLDKIALLRLDTKWYESTKCEMEYLYPRLLPKGVLIIDDYGIWKGSKKAVDEYFAKNNINPFLTRINTVGARLLIK